MYASVSVDGDPDTVLQGDRVLHLRYQVRRLTVRTRRGGGDILVPS
jgi:hypothetical protein